MHFDPRDTFRVSRRFNDLDFLVIVASHAFASAIIRRSTGHVDGFIIEGPDAGGHNAPPRGKLQLDESGQPVYDGKDLVISRRSASSASPSGWPGDRRRLRSFVLRADSERRDAGR